MNRKSKQKKRKRNNGKIMIIFIAIILVSLILKKNESFTKEEETSMDALEVYAIEIEKNQNTKEMEWNLMLVNYENQLPYDYKIPLEELD